MKKINFGKINITRLIHLIRYEKKITASTCVTLIRVVLTPIIVFAMVKNYWGGACVLFISAVLTDMIDGYLARLLNEKTLLGASLDALADKLLILACFCTLVFIKNPLFSLPPGFVLFVLTKEVVQLSGAFFLYKQQGYLDVRPTMLGKTTMLIQSCFIIWLFACYFFNWIPIKTYYSMLSLVVVLVSMSLVQYARIGFKTFFEFSSQ